MGVLAVRTIRNFVGIAVILSLAACGGEDRLYAPPSKAPKQHHAPPPSAPAVSEATFVAVNGSIDLFVIRSSELALQRSTSPRVRDFATTMIEAHKGTSGQLSLAGRRLNLLPSATLLPGDQAMLDALQASAQFDTEYVRDQRTVHQKAIQLDSAYATNGSSPTLRPVAKSALPIEQRHLRLLAYL
jgi:putative membrane protein